MGLCQSDPRKDGSPSNKTILEQNYSNPMKLKDSNQSSNNEINNNNNDGSQFLLRANINLNENQNSSYSLEKSHSPTNTNMTSPNNLMLGSVSSPRTKFEEKMIATFGEKSRNSIYLRLGQINGLSQNTIINNNNSTNQIEHISEQNEDSARNSVTSVNNINTKPIFSKFNTNLNFESRASIRKGNNLNSMMESHASIKKNNDFFMDQISRFNITNQGLYESKIYSNEDNSMQVDDSLYVITVISNPCQNKDKISFYESFLSKMEGLSNVKLITVEYTYMGLPFVLTQTHFEPYNIQYRTESPINLKYNLLNHVLDVLPQSALYIAWIDCNIEFQEDDWVEETLNLLQNDVDIIKLYKEFIISNRDGEVIVNSSHKNAKNVKNFLNFKKFAGVAWAAKKESLIRIGGFLDFCITNENDEIVNCCLEGKIEEILPNSINQEMKNMIKEWKINIEKNNLNFKILDKTVIKYVVEEKFESPNKRYNSGKKNIKKYDGWNIMIENNFNPNIDLIKDNREMYHLKREKDKLYRDLKDYFMNINDINVI